MRYILILIFSFSIAYSTQVQVSDSVKTTRQPFFKRIVFDASNTGKTIIKTYARPFHWQQKQWIQFGGALGISAAASLIDEPIYDYFKNHRNSTMNTVGDVGDFLGQPEHNYPFMLAIWGSGVVSNNDWLRDTGVMLFASVTTSGLIQTAVKELAGRARPGTADNNYQFKPFGGAAYHSFPSGHTMLALASAWILAHQVNYLPVKIIFYSVPVVTGVARMYVGAHWFSDILLGSALGIACAESVLRLYPKIKQGKYSGLSFVPTLNGAGLVYRFK